MIHRDTVTSVIEKYIMGGLYNQAKWKVENEKLIIHVGHSGRVCKIEVEDIPLPDCELGIHDSDRLKKLIAIMEEDIEMELRKNKSGTMFSKIEVNDGKYELVYSLADPKVIGKSTYYKDPEDWVVTCPVDTMDIIEINKAKKAMTEIDTMAIESKGDGMSIIFGDHSGRGNKISYDLPGQRNEGSVFFPFDAVVFRDILQANKDCLEGTLEVGSAGFLRMRFSTDGIESEYYIARNEE